ncbi:MAG: DNA polymerase III subunit delta' [Gammaproteobacteria bacterium]|nr:DNA polymerase III subunit delta' [Gammaproteobacteria bacterium]
MTYPWHADNWKRFEDMLAGRRLGHGLLLTGAAGLGKREFAGTIAQRMLCAERTGCGNCKGCQLFAAGNHPDFAVIEPADDSRQIKVEQVRDLIARLGLASQQRGYKVVIVDPAEAMNANAQNSLLKTLEEPADNTLLLLVCNRPAELAATILSRCQQLRFAAPAANTARDWLSGQAEADWDSLLVLAAGAPLAALELEQAGVATLVDELANDLAALMDGQSDPVAVAESWAGDDLALRLRWLQRQIYAIARWQAGQSPELVHRIILKSLQKQGQDTSVKSIFRYLDVLERNIRLTDRTVNQALAILPLLSVWADGPRFSQVKNEML